MIGGKPAESDCPWRMLLGTVCGTLAIMDNQKIAPPYNFFLYAINNETSTASNIPKYRTTGYEVTDRMMYSR